MAHLLSTFRQDDRGGVALIIGLALPILMGVTAAAVEYGALSGRRSDLQAAADSGSMAGVNQFKLANTEEEAAIKTAERTAKAQAGSGAPAGRETRVAAIVQNRRSAVHVTVTETVPLTFGRLINTPEVVLTVESTAKLSGTTRLCLLALDPKAKGAFLLESEARVTATDCSLYSNSSSQESIKAKDNAVASALTTCSAGGYDGRNTIFTPPPFTGCPALKDPLIDKSAPRYSDVCDTLPLSANPKNVKPEEAKGMNVISGSYTLKPGTYCGGLRITETAQVTLDPGIYVMKDGPLFVDKKASMTGVNVGFFFTGDRGSLLFDKDTVISLTAPKEGDMAGLLFFEDRLVGNAVPLPAPDSGKGAPKPAPDDDTKLRQYRIISDGARTLLGTIYLPRGRLIIDSKKPIADLSAYTVIVARMINLYDGPNLTLNARYGATDIPVPKGVGPTSGTTTLSQ